MSRLRADTGNQLPFNFGFLITPDEKENRAKQNSTFDLNITVTNYGLNKMEPCNI